MRWRESSPPVCLPGAMEIMDRLAIQAAEAAVHPDYPPGAEAVLIVELEGEVRGGGRKRSSAWTK